MVAVEVLGAEDQGADGGVDAVGADEQIRALDGSVGEGHGHLVAVLGDGGGPGAVANLHQVSDRLVQGALQIAAQQDPHRGAVDLFGKGQAGCEVTAGVDFEHASLGGAAVRERVQKAQAFGGAVARAVEPDGVAAGAAFGCPLGDQGLPAGPVQAQRGGQTGDAGSDDEGAPGTLRGKWRGGHVPTVPEIDTG